MAVSCGSTTRASALHLLEDFPLPALPPSTLTAGLASPRSRKWTGGSASRGHGLPLPRGLWGWAAGAESRRAGAHQWSCVSGERKEGEKGSLWDPRVRSPSPAEPLWTVQSILQECHDPNGAPVKAVFSRNATRRAMAPLKQKSHCESKMPEWGRGLYLTADRAQWAGRARVTEGQLWPKGHRSFCVTRMGLSGGSLHISTPVHPSEPGPGPAPTGTQSCPPAAARPVEARVGPNDGCARTQAKREARMGAAPGEPGRSS